RQEREERDRALAALPQLVAPRGDPGVPARVPAVPGLDPTPAVDRQFGEPGGGPDGTFPAERVLLDQLGRHARRGGDPSQEAPQGHDDDARDEAERDQLNPGRAIAVYPPGWLPGEARADVCGCGVIVTITYVFPGPRTRLGLRVLL